MAPSQTKDVPALEPSKLGTKEYWADFYRKEQRNYEEDDLDEGTEWFSDVKAGERMARYVEKTVTAHDGSPTKSDHQGVSVLDLGTGNGHLLHEINRLIPCSHLHGVDYSPESIKLAESIAHGSDLLDGSAQVAFEIYDLMKNNHPPKCMCPGGYDFVLDKGTFDAISLSSEVDSSGRRIFENYSSKVFPLICDGGLLVITSCNWTEDELKHWILRDFTDSQLSFFDRIDYPKFHFGGKEGQSVCTIIFKKNTKSD